MGCTASTATAVPEEKKRFHQVYRLGAKLGEGAFGQVRLASPRDGTGELAVKVVDVRRGAAGGGEPAAGGEADRERLLQTRTEIRVWEQIDAGPHCVQLRCHFFERNLFYMVMERCDCSLMDRLSRMSTMMEHDMVRIFSEMLMGIRHVHAADIVHRDVKPDNFLFGGPDGTTVKLCDFGLAARLPKKGLLSGVYGTAPYMSPEMLRGDGYDAATDVWSYGVTAFLMIHGDFPYSPREPTAAGMKKAILVGAPEIRFARAEGEEELFGRAFVERATPFLQALLQRAPSRRRAAGDALGLPFLSPDAEVLAAVTVSAAEPPLAPAFRKARKATNQLRRPADPIEQRDLDELLLRLQGKLGNSDAPAAALFFSESDEREGATDPHVKPEPSEDRIRRRSETRHGTHSGVVSGQDLASMRSLSSTGAESASTVTGGYYSSGRSGCSSPDTGTDRPKSNTYREAVGADGPHVSPSMQPPMPRKPVMPSVGSSEEAAGAAPPLEPPERRDGEPARGL